MSKKGNKKGTKMSLGEFGAGVANEGNLDWARDEFAPTPPTGPAEAGDMPPSLDGKKGRDWRDFGFKTGSMDNFRDAAPILSTKIVPEDLAPPFLAYVGNLPHNIAPEIVEASFSDVVEVKIIKRDRSTFAYVEFDSRDALQSAIIMTGKNVGGRKINVDLASDQQRARMEQEKSGNSGRESAVAAFGGRDAMGQAVPEGRAGGRGGMGSRMGSRNASAMDLAFGRESMGQAVSSEMASPAPEFSRDQFGEAKPRTPNSSAGRGNFGNFRDRSKPESPVGGGAPDFTNWRDSERVEQPPPASPAERGAPTFARRKEREEKTPDSGAARGDGGSWRDASGGGSWRDAPQEKQPEPAAKQPKTAQEGGAAKPKSPAAPAASGASWRDAPAAEPPAAKPKAASSENPWRQGPPK